MEYLVAKLKDEGLINLYVAYLCVALYIIPNGISNIETCRLTNLSNQQIVGKSFAFHV